MKVLLADDSAVLRDRFSKMIYKIPGITTIYEAANTTEALDIFRDVVPDIVILDISMPFTSGIDLLEIMKEERPQTPIIILTNYPSDQYKVVCKRMGADFFLVKSDDFYKIPKVIKKLIKKIQDNQASN